jgi:hypothetical protein
MDCPEPLKGAATFQSLEQDFAAHARPQDPWKPRPGEPRNRWVTFWLAFGVIMTSLFVLQALVSDSES